jgi:hypothetical protein
MGRVAAELPPEWSGGGGEVARGGLWSGCRGPRGRPPTAPGPGREELCRWAWWGRLRCICRAYELGGSAGGEEGRIPVACSPKSARRATGNGRTPAAGEEGLAWKYGGSEGGWSVGLVSLRSPPRTSCRWGRWVLTGGFMAIGRAGGTLVGAGWGGVFLWRRGVWLVVRERA